MKRYYKGKARIFSAELFMGSVYYEIHYNNGKYIESNYPKDKDIHNRLTERFKELTEAEFKEQLIERLLLPSGVK